MFCLSHKRVINQWTIVIMLAFRSGIREVRIVCEGKAESIEFCRAVLRLKLDLPLFPQATS